jgi:hypothetical protein
MNVRGLWRYWRQCLPRLDGALRSRAYLIESGLARLRDHAAGAAPAGERSLLRLHVEIADHASSRRDALPLRSRGDLGRIRPGTPCGPLRCEGGADAANKRTDQCAGIAAHKPASRAASRRPCHRRGHIAQKRTTGCWRSGADRADHGGSGFTVAAQW